MREIHVREGIMVKVLSALVFMLAVLQAVLIVEFIDLQGTVNKVVELNEKRARAALEAEELALKNERMRHTYLKVILDAQGLPEDK